jgi:hypothetical protein
MLGMRTKLLLLLSLLLSVLTLVACQLPNGSAIDVGAVVRDTVTAVDRNHDGAVTNAELKGAKNDPMLWITLGNSLVAAFGLAKAQMAGATAKKVETETDEQWERMAKL